MPLIEPGGRGAWGAIAETMRKRVRDCAYCQDEATSYIPDVGDVCEACKETILREEESMRDDDFDCEFGWRTWIGALVFLVIFWVSIVGLFVL